MNKDFLQKLRLYLWEHEGTTRAQRGLMRAGQYLFVLGRDLLEGQLTMRAMSLVYTSLLSLVPMLALAFSVLKALGVHNSLEPLLLRLLEPLGGQAAEVTQNIIGFVEKIQVGVLGSLGVALLFYSAISMIQKVESSFNYIWRVERPRPLSQRLGEYIAVLIVGPVLVFSAIGITATVLKSSVVAGIIAIEPFGWLVYLATKLLPYVLIVAAFTFLYGFIPNTKIKPRAALAGGVLAGVLWQSGSLAFASFVSGATNYNAIYSGFAIIVFLLIWVYLGWLILLVGCSLAFYVQHPEHLTPTRIAPTLSNRQSEYLALLIMALAGKRFIAGERGYTHDELALAANAAPEHVDRVVEILIAQNLLTESGADGAHLIPAIDLDALPLAQLWRRVRSGLTPLPRNSQALARDIGKLLDGAEDQFEHVTKGLSLRAWLMRDAS